MQMQYNAGFEAAMQPGDGGVNQERLNEEARKKAAAQAAGGAVQPLDRTYDAARGDEAQNMEDRGRPPASSQPAAAGRPAPQQTFAQMQQQGMARPAPPAPAPAPASAQTYQAYGGAPQTPVGGASPEIQAQIQRLMANPSYYTNEQFNKDIDRKGQGIDDDYALQEKKMREEMVARGLSESSIQGGRLADLNVGRRQARTDLVAQMASDRAKQMDEAQFKALTAGMDLERLGIDYGKLGLEGQRVGLEAERNRLDSEFNRAKLALDEKVSMGQLSQGQAKLELDRISEENDRKYKEAALTFDKDKYSSEKEYRSGRDAYEESRDAISDVRYGEEDKWRKETWQADYDAMLAKLLGTNVVKYGGS